MKSQSSFSHLRIVRRTIHRISRLVSISYFRPYFICSFTSVSFTVKTKNNALSVPPTPFEIYLTISEFPFSRLPRGQPKNHNNFFFWFSVLSSFPNMLPLGPEGRARIEQNSPDLPMGPRPDDIQHFTLGIRGWRMTLLVLRALSAVREGERSWKMERPGSISRWAVSPLLSEIRKGFGVREKEVEKHWAYSRLFFVPHFPPPFLTSEYLFFPWKFSMSY